MIPVMMNQYVRYAALGAAVLASAAVVGCAASRNAALERARTAYTQAQQDPEVSTNASLALHEAEAALRQTEQTWESSKDAQEVEHLAYLTEKKVDIARATAAQKTAEAEARRLNDEREQVVIDARTREAEHAQGEARARALAAEQARREAQEATARATQLEQELAALKAKQTERGLVLTLGDVLFEYNKADLKPGAMQNLFQLVTFLRENPERNLLIEGHTDSIGSDSYNLDLSQRRAEAVQSFLLQNGIRSERMIARGYGKMYPVASNDTEAGRQQNRRVEIVVLKEGESAAGRMRF
ncbi:MAG: OmpA family protein [Candidatus Binatia bacterium]